MAVIGARLRELRKQRNLTLKQVAEATGFAVSYLSQLERDRVSISVDNLERLSRFYEVHMVHFFRGTEENPVLITRRDAILERMQAHSHGPAAVTLLADRANAQMEPMLVKLNAGSEEPHFRTHDADMLLYILEGEALLIDETGGEVRLHAGDLAYYVNFPRRRIANASDARSLALIIITAPPTSKLEGMLVSEPITDQS